jgi:hypothetical protein
MTTGHQPSVFVSSTCYDLAQVRQDLRIFIETLGMVPLLSEFSSFPVNPNLDAIGNCIESVRDSTDIFVLVVGGRYGSETENAKSVTNLEYIEAKAKGIPCYVFVQKGILTTLPIWQKNQAADFSGVVDSVKLFEFVQSLRDPKENWVFPFESAQDITDTLRRQLGYLVKNALDIRHKVMHSGVRGPLDNMSAAALLLAVQKPLLWEYRLFSQLFADEIVRCTPVKRDLEYGIALGRAVHIADLREFLEWVQTKMGELASFAESAGKIVNVVFPKAAGPPGEPGDVDQIVYVARRFGQVYLRLLEWSTEFNQVQVEDEFTSVLDMVSRASQNAIGELEAFSASTQQTLADAVWRYERTKEPQSLEIKLTITCPDMTGLQRELHHLASRFGIPY